MRKKDKKMKQKQLPQNNSNKRKTFIFLRNNESAVHEVHLSCIHFMKCMAFQDQGSYQWQVNKTVYTCAMHPDFNHALGKNTNLKTKNQ